MEEGRAEALMTPRRKSTHWARIAALFLLMLLQITIPSGETEMPITITDQDIIARPWVGLGIGWDAETMDRQPLTLTKEQWHTLFTRIDYMRPAWIRSMINIAWFCPGGVVGVYAFTSPEMQAWYPILNYAKAHNIPVMIGTWDDVPWGFYSEGYATAITDLVQYLVKERGYTNIRYVNSLNEPDTKLPDFETWRAGARNIETRLAQRGLSSQVSLVGPDTSWTNGWITQSDLPWNNSSFLGAYEWHHYERTCCNIQDGLVESYFRPIVERLTGPERPGSKPVLLGEMGWGFQSGPGDNQYQVKTYRYGIEMADFAIQVARAGFSGGAAWDLDDAMHNKVWGMWNIVDEPEARPWFYSWALLSRYLPPGATLYRPASSDPHLRVVAAEILRSHNTNQNDISVAMVNRGDTPVNVELTLPQPASSGPFRGYIYSEDLHLDDLALPKPQELEQSGQHVNVRVPANALLLATNLDYPSNG